LFGLAQNHHPMLGMFQFFFSPCAATCSAESLVPYICEYTDAVKSALTIWSVQNTKHWKKGSFIQLY